jgi:hypothetical protein
MSKLVLNGDTSGSVTLDAPAVSGTTTLTLPTTSGTLIVNSGAQTIEFADGSASTPSITNSGDTNTGMFFPAADTIAASTGGSERMRIDSSGYITNAVNGLGNGIVQAQQYYRLNSGRVGANATGAQSIFGVGVTLVGSTQYEFEGETYIVKTAGTTSHTVAISFGGTATVNNFYSVNVGWPSDSTSAAGIGIMTSATTPFVTTGSITSAAYVVRLAFKGTVSVNAGGTFIPQYTLSAAPGGAYTTQIGSYFKIAPLAASGANVSIGSWA